MLHVDTIKKAFSEAPYPGSEYDQISATEYDDEGVYDYFVGSDQFEHRVSDLRYHSCALSFFTNEAFRYWLPAFMIAELTDPVEADIIGEYIAYALDSAQGGTSRVSAFNYKELVCISRFLQECMNSDEGSPYAKALSRVTRAKNLAEQGRAHQSTTRPESKSE